MASIRKRGQRWQVQVRRQQQPAISGTFTYKADAEAWARRVEAQLERGEVFQDSTCETSFSEVLTRYETEVTAKKRGAGIEVIRLRTVHDDLLAKVQVSSLRAEHVAAYRDRRSALVSPGTVRRELAIIQHCIEVARREWGYPFAGNPASQVAKPPPSRPRSRRLGEDELQKVAESLASCRNKLIRPAFLFALATGMRRGEVLSLVWSNISWQDRTALLPITKNGEPRTVPLSPSALQVPRGEATCRSAGF